MGITPKNRGLVPDFWMIAAGHPTTDIKARPGQRLEFANLNMVTVVRRFPKRKKTWWIFPVRFL